MKSEFLKNTATYITTNFFSKGLTFILWVLLAWYLAPEEIGQYNLVFFVIEIFMVLNLFNLSSMLLRFYYNKDTKNVLSHALVLFGFFTVVMIPLFLLVEPFASEHIKGLGTILHQHRFLILGIIAASSFTNLGLTHYTAKKQAGTYGRLIMLKSVFMFAVSLLLVYVGFGIQGLLIAHLSTHLLIAILFILRERHSLSFRHISKKTIRAILHYSFPLVLNSFLAVVYIYISRLFLDSYSGLATLGIFSFFLLITTQVNQIWSHVNQAWTPKIFTDFTTKKRHAIPQNIAQATYLFSFLYLVLIVIGILIGDSLVFPLVFPDIYIPKIHILYILLLGPLFTGIYTAAYPLFYYHQRTKRVLRASIVITGINVLLTLFMVTQYQELGAAITWSVTSMFSTLIYLLFFVNHVEIPVALIRWTLVLGCLAGISVTLLLLTGSLGLFSVPLIIAAIIAYRKGNLGAHKSTLREIIRFRN